MEIRTHPCSCLATSSAIAYAPNGIDEIAWICNRCGTIWHSEAYYFRPKTTTQNPSP